MGVAASVGASVAGGGVGVGEEAGGVGVGLVRGGVGDALLALGVGVAVVLAGLADGLAVVLAAVAAAARTEGVAAAVTGTSHDTVYAAGLDAAATGLVTTSTASPDAGRAGGVIASAGTALVPGVVKVTVPAAEF